jgi:RNA polymerase-binding transcription factor DksA
VAPAKKAVVKPAPKKAVKPVKKASPAKKVAPAKKVVAKPAPKKVIKVTPKKAEKAPKKAVKPEPKKAVKPERVKKAEVQKPVKEAKVAAPKKILKAGTPLKKTPVKPVKASGIEKSTTVIPMKQKPMIKKEEPVKEVKIPKTTVKSSVPYNPGYTPLENRTEKAIPGAPLVKYSDSDLNEFRDIINKKLEAAKKELAYFQGVITRKDESGDNEDGRYMTMEDGSLSMEREQLSQMASRTIGYIDNLKKALMRIENKTYGVCRVTGKLIDKARLRAVPHATLSLEAKLGLVKPSSAE